MVPGVGPFEGGMAPLGEPKWLQGRAKTAPGGGEPKCLHMESFSGGKISTRQAAVWCHQKMTPGGLVFPAV